MSELKQRLERLGLTHYFDALVSEGFDTWEIILDITESDLTELNFKLGHRRKLQRAIAESRGAPVDRALVDGRKPVTDVSYKSGDDSAPDRHVVGQPHSTTASVSGAKRKYRRHPKQDVKAPDRPPSAYVIFSNQVREELRGQDLSFTEIAKVVGEKWQVLPAEIRETCEQQANSAKERYYTEMAEYKKTPDYARYQEYLAEFKAKHGSSRAEGKRSRLESEGGNVSQTGPNSADGRSQIEVSRLASHCSAVRMHSNELLHAQQLRRPSSSSSPAVYPDVLHSPIELEPEIRQGSSPRSTLTMTRRHARASSRGSEAYNQEAQYYRHGASQLPFANYRPAEAWTASDSNQAPYLSSFPGREVTTEILTGSKTIPSVPALTRQESIISSTNSSIQTSSQGLHTPLTTLSPIDASLAQRTLPAPIMIAGPRKSPLDQRALPLPRPVATTIPHVAPLHSHSGSGSNWTTLLRASQLAREAEVEPKIESP